MDLNIRVDVSRACSAAIGEAHGLTPEELRGVEPRLKEAHEVIVRERESGVRGFYDLYKDQATIDSVCEAAGRFREMEYANLVVLGIGGSALGTKAIGSALLPRYYNLMTRRGRGGPRLFVMDNVDPVTFRGMMRLCPPAKTLYYVVSKSGRTAETMAQLMIVLEAIERKIGKDAMKDHVVVTTTPRPATVGEGSAETTDSSSGQALSLLHPVADMYGLVEFEIPPNVGGRFSVFSPVGMFPLAVLGIDIEQLREGCRAMDDRCSEPDLKTNPAYLHAAVQYLADTRKGKRISVMMPYSDGLYDIADWYRQLWAESLGKRFSLDGEEVFVGPTPVKALGATDQHSQIQLYREGPNDKIINVLEVRRFAKTVRIPEVLTEIDDLSYLRGKTMNRLMGAELRGTIDALKAAQRPVVRIVLPRLNAHTVAQLIYMLEVETAVAGLLYNVQAFDQPGVEEGKRIARQLMGQR